MALHRWHRDNAMVLTNQQMAIHAGNGTDLQWTSPVTIMRSSVTLENDGKSYTAFDNDFVLT
eukprot:1699381-Amphidinium_carterae.1